MIASHLTALLLLFAAAPSPTPVIVAPDTIVAGDAVPVVVRGLPPGADVEISAEQRASVPLRSVARFKADRSGVVDLARAAPVSGNYAGRDGAGLFWAMHRSKEQPTDLPVGVLRLSVVADGRRVAVRDVAVLETEPGLVVSAVPGFAGATLHRKSGDTALPVVVLLGGSEGGDSFGRSMVPFLTRSGYAALVLPYYAPSWITDPAMKGLPAAFADIPVDRLARLRDWMASQPELDGRRIAIIGASKGAEFAMIAAAHYPWLRAVVGIVPSDVVWEGWGPGIQAEGTRSSFALAGQPLPFVPYTGMATALAAMGRGEPAMLAPVHVAGRRDHPDEAVAAEISVERYRGPMMVVGGGQDTIWPSSDMARRIALRRQAAGLRTALLVFPGAGHNLSGSGWQSLNAWGTDPAAAATARAQKIVRQRLARFLNAALQ